MHVVACGVITQGIAVRGGIMRHHNCQVPVLVEEAQSCSRGHCESCKCLSGEPGDGNARQAFVEVDGVSHFMTVEACDQSGDMICAEHGLTSASQGALI